MPNNENNLELLANLAQLLSFYILLNDNTAEKLSQRLLTKNDPTF